MRDSEDKEVGKHPGKAENMQILKDVWKSMFWRLQIIPHNWSIMHAKTYRQSKHEKISQRQIFKASVNQLKLLDICFFLKMKQRSELLLNMFDDIYILERLCCKKYQENFKQGRALLRARRQLVWVFTIDFQKSF